MATFDNNLMARVLLSNKLASREVLIEAMKDVTPATDIGQVLVEAGILKPEIYAKLCDFLRKYQAQQAAKEAASRPQVIPDDGLGVALDAQLQSTAAADGMLNADSVEMDSALQATAFGGGIVGEEGAETAEGLNGSLLEGEGMEAFRAKVLANVSEMTPQMTAVDDALFDMASRGEITWDDAARRCFDVTRFPRPGK